MKKRLLAMLLVLMLVVSLLPTGALAADDVSVASENSLFTLNYRNDGAMNNTINVNLYNVDGEEIDTLTIDDARTAVHTVTVSLAESIRSEYDIEYVTVSGAADSVWNQRLDSYSVNLSSYTNDGAVINVYLCDALVIPDGLIEYGENGDVTSTRYYRIYDDQILKILHDKNVDVSASTTITAIKPNWKHEFSENYREFDDLNRETDYWALTVTSGDANVAEVQPTNISGLTISYEGDSGSGEVTVPTGDLRYLKDTEAVADRYYRIELNDDSFHIVYFYNEPGAQVINNYELYDIRFVEHGGNLVGNMPVDPTYPASSYYEFVAWTYDYNAGRPFLETTTVSEDITVYAQKRTTTSNNSWIYVMNDSDLLKERITELYNEAYVDWNSVKITVYDKDGEHTNPDYNLGQYNGNGWRDNGGYYHVYNYLSGVGDQQNESIAINNISKIVITANDISGYDLGPVTIEKGIYDGDFWVSAGNTAAQHIAYIYINDNGVEDPDEGGEEPGPEPVAKLDVTKAVAIPGGKDTAAVGDKLEYTVTITSLNSVAATGVKVTDTMWSNGGSVIINGTSYSVDSGSVTVDVPANGSMVIYYTYTVPETDAGKTVDNTVTAGTASAMTSTAVDEAEEPEEPGKPSEPTEDELNQLAVVLDCINADVEHKNITFHLDKDNSFVTVDFTMGICTVQPKYDFILQRYNEETKAEHHYDDDAERTLTLTWDGETWIVAGDASITRQVKCETPEQQTWPVMLFIYQNGDTENAVKTIKLADVVVGGQYRTTEDALDELVKEHYIPGKGATGEYVIEGYYNDGGWNLYRAGNKDNKLDLTQSITVNDGWYNIHVMVTDYEKVQIVIYRDGDTVTPYKTIPLENMLKGETLDTTKLDISKYYTPDKFATGFEWEGWFNDGAWNNYKNAGCPADAAGLDEIYINGWTNVIAMVWDQFPVYYNIVDENGTVVEEKIYTDTITERDLEDYTFYNASRTGYTFDGWYQDEKDVGDASKLLTGLNKAKKWELYGRYDPIPYNLVIYAAIDKDKDNAVKIYSGMVDYGTPLVEYLESLTLETDVFPGYSPEDGKWYKYDSLAWTFGENDTVSGWTNVLINYVPNKYTIYYHGNGGMTGSGAVQSTSNFKYGSEATIKNNPFTYDGYVFEGWARSADGEVVYTGSEKVPFTEEEFPGLLENGKVNLYAVWAVDKLGGGEDGNKPDGVPDKYQATVKFVAGENGKVTGDVTKVYTIFGADGKYAEKGVITPSLEGVTVTPDEGYKVDGWTNAANERVDPESEITVKGGDVVVFTVNFQSDPSLKEITSFEKKLVTDRRTYHSFGLRVPTFIRNGSTVVVDEGKGVTLLYAISLTGTPGAEYAITDTGADVADGSALTGVIPETGVVTVYVTKDFTWREAAAAAYKDDALVNTAAVELTDNPNEPGQESTEEVDVVIDWDDPNVPVVPSDPDDDDDEDEDDEVFVPNWLNTTDHYAYIVGYEDGTIRPQNNITRAEVSTIFFRLLTDNARARYWSQTNDYTDVAADSWYNNAVSTLSNMGIINGYEDGTFKPNAPITRAEFTAIATRFFDYEAEYDGAFNDVSARAWYADYVQAAVDMGLVDGYPDGGFHPDAYITRAEACTIVNRVLNRAPHEDHLLDEDEMNVWPDNVYGAWYYADMQEATNSHDYDWIRVSGERVEEWTEKLPERDWAALEQEWSSSHDA